MNSISNIYSRLYQTRFKPYLLSIPYYLWELSKIRSFNEFISFIYFKYPVIFPFAVRPLYVTVELTTLCNLNCIHCWRKRALENRGIGSIDLADFRKIISEVKNDKTVAFKIGGAGEPALHPQFLDIMAELEKLRATETEILVYTNGTLFKKFSFDDISSWNLDRIVLSVDGIDESSYEKTRLEGSYDIMKTNATEFFEKRKVRGLRKPLIEVRHVIFPYERLQQLFKFRKLWSCVSDVVKFQCLNEMKTIPVFNRQRHPRREISIQWNGNVPVPGVQNEFVGNIQNYSISQMWQKIGEKIDNFAADTND